MLVRLPSTVIAFVRVVLQSAIVDRMEEVKVNPTHERNLFPVDGMYEEFHLSISFRTLLRPSIHPLEYS